MHNRTVEWIAVQVGPRGPRACSPFSYGIVGTYALCMSAIDAHRVLFTDFAYMFPGKRPPARAYRYFRPITGGQRNALFDLADDTWVSYSRDRHAV